MTPPAKPIIIIKKKISHGGHHGGAWKVAYADFVTAMMVLFIVFWLLSSSVKVKKAVAGYFNDPSGTSKLTGTDKAGAADNFVVTKENMADLKDQLEKTVRELPDFDKIKNNIDMTITNEGLRIELTESAAGTCFDSGSPKISKDGAEILEALAGELGKLPNKIALEGHTDAKPYAAGATFGNWELSSERANAARRLMVQHDLRTDQVTQVRGFADQRLRKPSAPLDPSNRRISLIVQYQQKTKEELEAASVEGEKKGEGEGKSEGKRESKSEAQPEARKPAEAKPAEGKKE